MIIILLELTVNWQKDFLEIRRNQSIRPIVQNVWRLHRRIKKISIILLGLSARLPHESNTHVRVFGCIRDKECWLSHSASNFRVSRGWILALAAASAESAQEFGFAPIPSLSRFVRENTARSASTWLDRRKQWEKNNGVSPEEQIDARHDRAQHEMNSHDDFARQRTSNFYRTNCHVGA